MRAPGGRIHKPSSGPPPPIARRSMGCPLREPDRASPVAGGGKDPGREATAISPPGPTRPVDAPAWAAAESSNPRQEFPIPGLRPANHHCGNRIGVNRFRTARGCRTGSGVPSGFGRNPEAISVHLPYRPLTSDQEKTTKDPSLARRGQGADLYCRLGREGRVFMRTIPNYRRIDGSCQIQAQG